YWPPACDDLYRDVHIPDAALSDPAFFNALPDFMKTSLNRIRWKWRFNDPDKYQKMVKGYYRMISGVDLEVGKLIHELKRLGLFKDTIIIFTGDNGYFLGERGFAGKWLLHEPSIRVPLIIFHPQGAKKNRGGVFAQPALNIDIAPTILAMAGVSPPERMQGMSLLPLFDNESSEWRREIFCEHLYNYPGIPKSEGIRTSRWKYIRYLDHPEYRELYDLQNDVLEARNLAKDRQYHQIFLKLDKRCD
ncbi:MAG: sulfatase-like hydrolase/transferase, partial [bacterium]|nr:sulfatase-like hydrolase/transferase [bacterium]